MPASKMKAKKIKKAQAAPSGKRLNAELARLEKKYAKLTLEKNFLERAVGDLNFHNNAHDGIVYTDAKNRIVYANPYFLQMMGVKKKKDLLEQPFPDYMWNSEKEAKRLFADIKKEGFVREREMALHNQSGQAVFAMCSGVTSKDETGKIVGSEIMFCNITGKRTFQAELVEQSALLDAMLESTPDPVLVLTPELAIRRSNPSAQKLFAVEKLKSKENFMSLLTKMQLAEETRKKVKASFGEQHTFEIEVNLGDQHFELHVAPLKSQQKGWVCTLHNITVRKHTQEMLQRHAFHDVLTQLPNRAYFRDFLERANLRTKSEPDYGFAVLFVDLDSLKSINDKWGHHIGDQLLMETAKRLESSIRPGDLVSRLGGDEFAVLVDGVRNEGSAVQVAGRIRDSLTMPFILEANTKVSATASIGIALSEKFNEDVDLLLRNADKAMYLVKKRGGNSYEIFGKDVLG